MADTSDMELMRQYAEDHSESAFAELVRRHNRREELTDEVFKNITGQTGLTFTNEKHFVDVWFATEQK